MALRVANMVEAQLPATPDVATFVQGMLAIVLSDPTPPPQVVRSDMFDGALHAVVETIPKGSKKVQEAILKLFGQFGQCGLYKDVNVVQLHNMQGARGSTEQQAHKGPLKLTLRGKQAMC